MEMDISTVASEIFIVNRGIDTWNYNLYNEREQKSK